MRTYLNVVACSALLALPLAGCVTTAQPVASPAATPAQAAQSAFAGTWSGALETGASVRVQVPANGNASYFFRDRRVTISSTVLRGDNLVLRLTHGGTVTLVRAGDKMNYFYRSGTDSAQATLSRS